MRWPNSLESNRNILKTHEDIAIVECGGYTFYACNTMAVLYYFVSRPQIAGKSLIERDSVIMAQPQSPKYQSPPTPSFYEPPITEEDTARKLQTVHPLQPAAQRPSYGQRYEAERIRRLRRLDQILLGAMLATFIGGLGVLIYLVTTVYTTSYAFLGTPLINYVTTHEYGNAFDTSESLTVIVARFLLGFGLTWAPLTMGVAFVEWLGRQFRSND